jgi:hypothetical protein
MPALLSLALLLAAPASCPPQDPACLGTLWDREEDWCPGGGQSYQPREGDLVFFSSLSCFYSVIFTAAGSGHPWHVGIVARDSCGELCVLEAGGHVFDVSLIPVEFRMRHHLAKRPHRRVWVRRVKAPLTPEQSRCLTEFAEAQEGKRFAACLRIAALGLPCRPLRPTEPDQARWFCAELVSEALRLCGTCPACWMVPEKTTPRDLFFDRRDLSCGWLPPETWSPDCDPPPPGPLCAPR